MPLLARPLTSRGMARAHIAAYSALIRATSPLLYLQHIALFGLPAGALS